jgi:hypothetical protein
LPRLLHRSDQRDRFPARDEHRHARARELAGFVTVHHGHQAEIEITGTDSARAVWAFTDRFFYPPGARYSRFIGYGHYHDTYTRDAEGWKLQTMRFTRLWVEAR